MYVMLNFTFEFCIISVIKHNVGIVIGEYLCYFAYCHFVATPLPSYPNPREEMPKCEHMKK